MEESIAAYIKRMAPREKQVEWHQKGLKRTLSKWEREHPDLHEIMVTEKAAGGAVGYTIIASEIGQYGYDTNFYFTTDLDVHLIDDIDGAEEMCEAFYEDWVAAIVELIKEDQSASMFSPKELAVLYASRDEYEGEQEAADALGITVGTYRGKLGRVRDKLSEARTTIRLAENAIGTPDDDTKTRYAAPLTVIDRVEEERLPVDAIFGLKDLEITETPVELLLRDESSE